MTDLLNTPEKKFFLEFIDRNHDALTTLNDSIFYFGELGMQEYRTSELMCSLLEEHGFDVTLGACGFPTGFVATYGSGAPVLAIHCEYDGNPANSQQPGIAEQAEIVPGAPGHCEGHNANGAVMVVTAIGLRYAMEKFAIDGTLKIVGAPAEESLISRPYFVRDGVFDDVDVAFHAHIHSGSRAYFGHVNYAAISAEFIFHGESAHAATEPHKARSALDAVVLMDMGMAQFREHFEPNMIAHRVITHGGHQPNVIPARASVWWYFRHPFAEGARRLFEQATKIAQGAAMMTNCEVEVDVRSAVWPVLLNETVSHVVHDHMLAVGSPEWNEEEHDLARSLQRKLGKPDIGLTDEIPPLVRTVKQIPSSNDSGDVSWKVPMVGFSFPGNVPGVHFHHWTAGAALATSITHKGCVIGAKTLGTSVLEYFTDRGDLLERTKRSFAQETGGVAYRSLLPGDQTPPVDLNRAEMDRYRPLMEPFYVKDRPVIAV